MSKKRLNADDAFQNIMGKNNLNNIEENHFEEKEEEEKSGGKSETAETAVETIQKEKLFPITLYITEKQRKAMKIKTALGNKPEDKDLSSIVRAALDVYLSDTLTDL